MPDTTDAYTHRIGRTGRVNNTGEAFTLVTNEDKDMIKALERILKTHRNPENRRIPIILLRLPAAVKMVIPAPSLEEDPLIPLPEMYLPEEKLPPAEAQNALLEEHSPVRRQRVSPGNTGFVQLALPPLAAPGRPRYQFQT